MHPCQTTGVLIAGGGPAGLALAIELGRRQVPVIVVDPVMPHSTADLLSMRHVGSPRAKLTNIRSMEHARRWGIADTLRATAPLGPGFPPIIRFVTRLNGTPLAEFDHAFGFAEDQRDESPEGPLQCPQFLVEAVFRDHAQTLPEVQLRYGWQLEGFAQTADAVEATIVDATGRRETIVAGYLAGCDGSRSLVRRELGIEMEGERSLGHSLSVIFRAPGLAERAGVQPAIHYWTVNADTAGMVGPLDGGDVWWSIASDLAPDGKSVRAMDPVQTLRGQIGFAFEPEILDVTPWAPHRLLAERFRDGRAFLVGDAAHLHAPFGGHGMNLGIGDGVDLGWKIAATRAGWGGEALLASYEAERRPLARRVIDAATSNYRNVANAFVRPKLEADDDEGRELRETARASILRDKDAEFHSVGLVCGYRYDASPVIAYDGTPAPADHITTYVPTSRPGARAPHLRLPGGGSLYDAFGDGFALLVAGGERDDAKRVAAGARRSGVPLQVVELDPAAARERFPCRYTLIRPDQHVAWRGDDLVSFETVLARATGSATVAAGARERGMKDEPDQLFAGPRSIRDPRERRNAWFLLLTVPVTLAVIGFVFHGITSTQVALLFVSGMVFVSLSRGRLLGSSIRVRPGEFPAIIALVEQVALRLGVAPPLVFIRDDNFVPVNSIGLGEPYALVLSSQYLDLFTSDELAFMIGREIGHIAAGNTRLLSLINASGRENPIVTSLFGGWIRQTEYTADRAGLLCAPLDAAVKAIAIATFHSSGRQVEAAMLHDQRRDIESDIILRLGELTATMPYAVNRVRSLETFVTTDLYRSWMLRIADDPLPVRIRRGTADGPVERGEVASNLRRGLAFGIDVAILSLIFHAVQTTIGGEDVAIGGMHVHIAVSDIRNWRDILAQNEWLSYFPYAAVLVALSGTTIGMMVLDLRVVARDHGRLGIVQSIWRYAVALVCTVTVVPLIYGLVRRVHLYDRLSGSRLVGNGGRAG